jgi:hypothetical protein
MSNKTLAAVFLLVLLLTACMPELDPSVGYGTQTAFAGDFMQTVTARSGTQEGSQDVLATIYANATQLSGDTTAQAVQVKENQQATEAAILPVLNELPLYGIDSLDGRVAWLHRPVTIDVNGYMQYGYANDYPAVIAGDFVLVSDITWNTQFASSGCGFMFRSNGDKEKPSQFMAMLTRMANGTIVFSAVIDGGIANTHNYYIRSQDKTFQWLNDSTNRFAVVVKGTKVKFFTNGVLVKEANTTDPPPTIANIPSMPSLPANPTTEQLREYQQQMQQYSEVMTRMQDDLLLAQKNFTLKKVAALTDGFVGFLVLSESGRSNCTFSNAWLFLMDKVPTPTPNRTWTRTPTPTITPTPRITFTPLGSATQTPISRYTPKPPTDVPPTDVPPTEVPPTEVPPTEVPPTEVPPTDVPATDVPATDIPATDVPPPEVPTP